MLPTEGALAPAFTAVDDTGKTVHLADYRGRWVVLFFYPKDDTPG
jgi:peroxiredoxin Q/BCP